MKRIGTALLAVLGLGLASLAGAQTSTLVEGMETPGEWVTVAGTGETLNVTAAASFTQGSGAIQLTYDFTAQDPWFKNANARKEFAAPVDLTSAEFFSYDINLPTAATEFILVIHFWDAYGNTARVVDYGAMAATTGWATRQHAFSILEKTRWAGSGRAIALNKVTAVSFHLQNQAATADSVLNFSLDNLRIHSGYDLLNEVVLEDFESYADDAAIQAAWPQRFGAGTLATLSTTNSASGTKAGIINADITAQWTQFGVEYTFASPQDFSTAAYFKVNLYGDALLAGTNPTAHVILQDNAGTPNRAVGYIWNYAANEEWQTIYMPFANGGVEPTGGSSAGAWGGASCWREDYWDGDQNGTTDLTQITKMIISIQCQGTATFPINGVDILYDDIIVGFASDAPPAPPVPSVKSYQVNYTAVAPTIDGVVSSGEWDAAAAPATGFVHHNNAALAATEDPAIRAMYDDNNLYILWEVPNSNFSLDFVPNQLRDPSGTSFSGDDFEMFISTEGNMGNDLYQIVLFPYSGDNQVYVWDAFPAASFNPASWDATGDQGAFTHTGGITRIEYKVPFSAFSQTMPDNGTNWGIQFGFINNSPAEAVNWEPDGTPGFASGRPLGTFTFLNASASAESWQLYN